MVIDVSLVNQSTDSTGGLTVSVDWENGLEQGFRLFHLTVLLLNTTCPVLINSVDPDQLASEVAN